MREIFLDDLPLKDNDKRSRKIKRIINWEKSINYKVKFIYDNIEGEVEITGYKDRYLSIKYLDKEPFEIYTSHFEKCALGKLLDKRTDEFKIEIGTRYVDNKRDITIIDRKIIKDRNNKNQKVYKYRCNRCGFECGEHYKNDEFKEEYWILESSLLKGSGCACCCITPRIVVENINSIVAKEETHWMIKYFQGGYDEAKKYVVQSNQRITPICSDCGRIKSKPMTINHIFNDHSIGCSCGDGKSYPEKFMYSVLEQLNIDFINEYSPDWIKPKRYDFYFKINNKEYIVEMDGGLGHGKKIHSEDSKTIEETLENDDYKDKLADEHNIEVIRIDCIKSKLEYIKSNILIKLNEILNLSNINWLKVEKFAVSNLVKEACEMKRNNPSMSTIDIGKIMKLHYSTIIKYLKQGTKLGWCDYDPKEEMRKSASKTGKNSGKPVEIFKDGISLGKFETVTELVNQSKEKFGTKLFQTYISSVCLGKRTQYKGYTFKYN